MTETLTIRVDPSVYQAIKAIADKFGWTTSDVASTLLWMSILGLDNEIIPEEVWRSLTGDMLRILANFAALNLVNPTKANDNLLKTALLLKSKKPGK